jgi:hypothetical protein
MKYQEKLLQIPFPTNYEKKNYLKTNIVIEFEKLGLVVGDSVVLTDVCGKFNSGKVTAIMVRLFSFAHALIYLVGSFRERKVEPLECPFWSSPIWGLYWENHYE